MVPWGCQKALVRRSHAQSNADQRQETNHKRSETQHPRGTSHMLDGERFRCKALQFQRRGEYFSRVDLRR
eukprot:5707960-Pleurochrysis_carterae.AAC.1